MRVVILVLLAMLAVKTSANGQGGDACQGGYIACIDTCVAGIAKQGQDKCIESCQLKNNQCYAGIHSAAPQSSRIVPLSPAESDEAMAAKNQSPASKPVKVVPR